MKSSLKRLLLASLAASACGAARAQEVVAVLGSDQRPYREAYESFQAALGTPVPVLALGAPVPAEAKIVVAFGGKAALQRYAGRLSLIYAIAPGLVVDRKTHDGLSIKIMLEPDADALLGALTTLQPKLKRLAVLWLSASMGPSAEKLVERGAARGISVSSEKLEDAGDLPGALRELKGKAEALWIFPDPMLISAANFEIIKHYSYENHVPFYAPTEGLAEKGATAAVFVSYQDAGREAASAARALLGGRARAGQVFSASVKVSLNRAAAAEAGLAP